MTGSVRSETRLKVNGHQHVVDVEARDLLLDVLRDRLALTGAHAACEQGSCGACTVLVDGVGVRSCLMFAVQADGSEVLTIEGVGSPNLLHPIQEALSECHGLQCGFCTPGVVLAALELLGLDTNPSRAEVEEALAGNVCRCTGYSGIIDGVLLAAARLQKEGEGDGQG